MTISVVIQIIIMVLPIRFSFSNWVDISEICRDIFEKSRGNVNAIMQAGIQASKILHSELPQRRENPTFCIVDIFNLTLHHKLKCDCAVTCCKRMSIRDVDALIALILNSSMRPSRNGN